MIATNLLGTVPDNPLSSGLRQALSVAFPEEFVDGLNASLDDYGMPTLPSAPEGVQADDETGIEATSEAPGESTAVSELTSEPLATNDMTSEPIATAPPSDETASPVPETPTFQEQTPEMDISGTWTYQYNFDGHEEYTFEDVITIEKQASGYVVTSVTDNYGQVTLVDQYWSGSYLEFYYEMPASTFPYETENTYLLYVKTLGMENGYLIIIDEWDIVYEMTRID
jgi:hypothetical protein